MAFRKIVTFSCLLMLVGCGFHIRGHQYSLKHSLPQALLEVNFKSARVERAFSQALKAAEVDVHKTGSWPRLILHSYHIDRSPQAYGVEGEVRRERIEAVLEAELVSSEGDTLMPKRRFKAFRDQLHFTAYDLANTSESERLEDEILSDLASQLVLQLNIAQLSQGA